MLFSGRLNERDSLRLSRSPQRRKRASNATMGHYPAASLMASWICIVWDAPAHGESRLYLLDFSLDDYALILHGILAKENISCHVMPSPCQYAVAIGGRETHVC